MLMKKIALILALIASPALATDYEVSASSYALIQSGLFAKGFAVGPNALSSVPKATSRDGSGDQYSICCYGTKYLPTGATTTNENGISVPVMAAQTGSFCIFRWLGPNAVPTIPGVTLIPIPANSPVVWLP